MSKKCKSFSLKNKFGLLACDPNGGSSRGLTTHRHRFLECEHFTSFGISKRNVER